MNIPSVKRTCPPTYFPAIREYLPAPRKKRSCTFFDLLPDEVIACHILPYLSKRELNSCSLVCRRFKAIIGSAHLKAIRFFQDHNATSPVTSEATTKRYQAAIRPWLLRFGLRDTQQIQELDEKVASIHLPKLLFYSVARAMSEAKNISARNVFSVTHSGPHVGAHFSPDGLYILQASTLGQAFVHRIIDGRWLPYVKIEHNDKLVSLQFSDDGNRLLTASRNGLVNICCLNNEQWQDHGQFAHFSQIQKAKFSPSGNRVVTTSRDNVTIFALAGGLWVVEALVMIQTPVNNTQFGLGDTQLVVTSQDRLARVFGLISGSWREQTVIDHDNQLLKSRFIQDGTLLTTAYSNSVTIHSLVNGQWQKFQELSSPGRLKFALSSPDGRYVVTVSDACRLRVFQQRKEKWCCHTLSRSRNSDILKSVFSPDSKRLLTIASAGIVQIYRLAGEKWYKESLIRTGSHCETARFDTDSCHFVLVSDLSIISIYGLNKGKYWEKGRVFHNCDGELGSEVCEVEFSNNGGYFLTNATNHSDYFGCSVNVWRLENKHPP